jgi:hypothetical protein
MGWERRGKNGQRLVYYRKKRVGKRVFSVYVGSGEVGELAEREDRERREAKHKVIPISFESPEVLQGATEVIQGATRGATPQVVVTATTIAEDNSDAWAKYLRPQVPSRRYRRW